MATDLVSVPAESDSPRAALPRVVLIIPRGEAARNFIYSDMLAVLASEARVTVLSVLSDDGFRELCRPYAEHVVPLRLYPEHLALRTLRGIVHLAHFKKLSSAVAKETLARRVERASSPTAALRRRLVNRLAWCLANEPALRALSALEGWASWRLRATDEFIELFRRLRPAVVFNGSHIHGPAALEPVTAAYRLGIPSAAFIFSWDNLTSRGRILGHYDYFFTWHEFMRKQLLSLYPQVPEPNVIVTGTPQFDFHFRPEYQLERKELCRRLKIDPARPFVLYTTGMDTHFPEEHRTVELAVRILDEMPDPKPQLVVRTYVKGTSAEMQALAHRNLPGVIFPQVLWEPRWLTPLPEDLAIYTSLLKHCAFGINAASTVSLELMMHDKPVINLGFDPPGSSLPRSWRFERHLEFDHYRPVVASGAVMVARSAEDMRRLIRRAFEFPSEQAPARREFLGGMFGPTLDGRSGARTAQALLNICRRRQEGA